MSDTREAELQEQLRAQQDQLTAQQEQLRKVMEELERVIGENALLRQKLDALSRRFFGVKSEKLNKEQLFLLLQGFDEGPAQGKESGPEVIETEPSRSDKVSKPRRDKKRVRVPEHLPVIEEVIVPDPVKLAPQDWRHIGDEVTELLDYEAARFLRRRTVRQKYVHRETIDAAPIIAPLPESLLERSIVAPGLLAQILVGKYCDHLPLYRQEYIYESRHGVYLPRETMARWVGLAADWLRPIYEEIRKGVLDGGYVQVDETPIRYLAPGNGKTKLGYFWVVNRPGGEVFFNWETSRGAACLDEIIPVDFAGKVQCDGYAAYECFARRHENEITLAGCMAHARRVFYEARELAPQIAGFILRQIQLLYKIEERLRNGRAGPRLREAVRASESRPIMERLHRLLQRIKIKKRYLPRSLMGKAVDYTLGQWSGLLEFLRDGRVEIDNNLVENAIRPTALGKKNWLFIGEAQAGDRSAIIYTIIECCRRRGIDPYRYLRDAFTRLPKMTNWQVKDITPQAWDKAQQAVPQSRGKAA
jgi:transposase